MLQRLDETLLNSIINVIVYPADIIPVQVLKLNKRMIKFFEFYFIYLLTKANTHIISTISSETIAETTDANIITNLDSIEYLLIKYCSVQVPIKKGEE